MAYISNEPKYLVPTNSHKIFLPSFVCDCLQKNEAKTTTQVERETEREKKQPRHKCLAGAQRNVCTSGLVNTVTAVTTTARVKLERS